MQDSPFSNVPAYRQARCGAYRGVWLARDFGDRTEEYVAARDGLAVCDRSDRGRLVLTGSDAKPWLHNLLTNRVEDLPAGQGAYAFLTNAQGRVQFDMNVLVLESEIWLDVDRLAAAPAAAALDRFLFAEDVQIRDATEDDARLMLVGPQIREMSGGAKPVRAEEMLELAHSEGVLGGRMFVNRLGTVPAIELIVPRAQAALAWRGYADLARPAGWYTLEALRIEAGLPWYGRDIDETVLPPETGQATRGISYDKGCFPGHEIIERMRSRGILARQLVRLQVAGHHAVDERPLELLAGGRVVGRVTSLLPHPAADRTVGLGYLSTSVAADAEVFVRLPGETLAVEIV
jgi:folate-binding protein YgfZ